MDFPLPRRLLALLCGAVLLCAGEFPDDLKTLAAGMPKAPFNRVELLPADFKGYLEARGFPSEAFTNEKVLELYEQFQGKKAGRGLRLYGLSFGLGSAPDDHNDEPFQSKGIEQLFDWDLRARVDIDGLGASAKYRHPHHVRSFSVGFLKHFDVPETFGLGGARDGLYRGVGSAPDHTLGGWEAQVSGAVNQYLGGTTKYDRKSSLAGDRFTDRTVLQVGAGISPLGDRPNKRDNFALLPTVRWESVDIHDPGQAYRAEGFGYSMAAAYQRALHAVPYPGNGIPGPFFLDRFKATVGVSQSAVQSFAIDSAVQVSFYLAKKIELTTGVKNSIIPSTNPDNPYEKTMNWGLVLGLDLHY
jgi:hypothetical protein